MLSADGANETLRSLALTCENDVDVEQTLAEDVTFPQLTKKQISNHHHRLELP